MEVLRSIGYIFTSLIFLGGLITTFYYFWPLGVSIMITSLAIMWALHKGGQMAAMQKSLKRMQLIEAENQELRQREAQITDFIKFQKLITKHWDDPN